MKASIVIFALIVSSISLQSQIINKDSIFIRGVIMESDSMFHLPFARYDIGNKITYVSDSNGEFAFWAQPGDVVSFSYVGFKTFLLSIVDSLSHNNIALGVFLSRDTIQLSEVIIIPPYDDPGTMAKKMPMLYTAEDIAAQRNMNRIAYQAKTQSELDWDTEMSRKYFLQSRAENNMYRSQFKPSQVFGISNTSINKARINKKLRKSKSSLYHYITPQEWKFLTSNYQERVNRKLKEIRKK